MGEKRRIRGEHGRGELKDRTMERKDGAEQHMTGRLWRLMTSPCQSSSHRESRALPSAPKLMGRRQGGEVRCADTAQRGPMKGEGTVRGRRSEREREENRGGWSKARWRPRTGKII